MEDKNSFLLQAVGQIRRQYYNQKVGNTLTAANNLAAGKNDPRLHAVCAEMESLFINYQIQEMRATIDKSGFISGGRAEEIFTSMLDVELSRKISAAGGLGLSSILLEQLGRQTPAREQSNLPSDAEASHKSLKP
jgi:Rod binding domain-containing protein